MRCVCIHTHVVYRKLVEQLALLIASWYAYVYLYVYVYVCEYV